MPITFLWDVLGRSEHLATETILWPGGAQFAGAQRRQRAARSSLGARPALRLLGALRRCRLVATRWKSAGVLPLRPPSLPTRATDNDYFTIVCPTHAAPGWALASLPRLSYRVLRDLLDGTHMPLTYPEGDDAKLLFWPHQHSRAHPFTSFDLSHVCERSWCARSDAS